MPLLPFSDNEIRSSIRAKINAVVSRVNAIDAQGGTTGIQWVEGNQLTRVTAQLLGNETYTLLLRPGGSPEVNPASAAGYISWQIEPRGMLPFYSAIGPYFKVGQYIMYTGRLYQLKQPYSSPPPTAGGTNAQWKDIFADAASGNDGDGIDPEDPTDPEEPPQPPPTPDGELTAYPYASYDVSQIWYTEAGTGGQDWIASSQIADFTGLGYAISTGANATQATGAKAFINNITFEEDVDKKAFVRINAAIGAQLGIRSKSNGTYSTVAATLANTWEWVEVTLPHKNYDRQLELTGLVADVAVDKYIITDIANTAVPSGKAGYRTS